MVSIPTNFTLNTKLLTPTKTHTYQFVMICVRNNTRNTTEQTIQQKHILVFRLDTLQHPPLTFGKIRTHDLSFDTMLEWTH